MPILDVFVFVLGSVVVAYLPVVCLVLWASHR